MLALSWIAHTNWTEIDGKTFQLLAQSEAKSQLLLTRDPFTITDALIAMCADL